LPIQEIRSKPYVDGRSRGTRKTENAIQVPPDGWSVSSMQPSHDTQEETPMISEDISNTPATSPVNLTIVQTTVSNPTKTKFPIPSRRLKRLGLSLPAPAPAPPPAPPLKIHNIPLEKAQSPRASSSGVKRKTMDSPEIEPPSKHRDLYRDMSSSEDENVLWAQHPEPRGVKRQGSPIAKSPPIKKIIIVPHAEKRIPPRIRKRLGMRKSALRKPAARGDIGEAAQIPTTPGQPSIGGRPVAHVPPGPAGLQPAALQEEPPLSAAPNIIIVVPPGNSPLVPAAADIPEKQIPLAPVAPSAEHLVNDPPPNNKIPGAIDRRGRTSRSPDVDQLESQPPSEVDRPDRPPTPPLVTYHEENIQNSNLPVKQIKLVVQIHPKGPNIEKDFDRALEQILIKLKKHARAVDWLNLTIDNGQEDTAPITMKFTGPDSFHPPAIYEEVFRVTQSNAAFSVSGVLNITCVILRNLVGGAPGTEIEKNLELFFSQFIVTTTCVNIHHKTTRLWQADHDPKKRIRRTLRKNKMCAAYAITIGEHHMRMLAATDANKKQLTSVYREACKQLSVSFAARVDELMRKAGINLTNQGASLDEIGALAAIIDWPLLVFHFTGDRSKREILFDSRITGTEENVLKLLFFNDHYYYLKEDHAFYNQKYRCAHCQKFLKPTETHRCITDCFKCFHDCSLATNFTPRKCHKCNFTFDSNLCYRLHQKPDSNRPGAKSRCDVLRICSQCKVMHKAETKHVCGFAFCRQCCEVVKSGHVCYINRGKVKPETQEKKSRSSLRIYFDAETEKTEPSGIFKVVCLTSETICHYCTDKEEESCDSCGSRSSVFSDLEGLGNDPMADFLAYLLATCKQKRTAGGKVVGKRRAYLISHNGSRFDNLFVLRAMCVSREWDFKELYSKGRKLNKLKCVHKKSKTVIILLDSMCFINCSLAALGKAFGVPEDKGFFPFKIIKAENRDMILDRLPALALYTPERLPEAKREALIKWHEEETRRIRLAGERWIYADEIVKYCRQDSRLLRLSFESFCTQMAKFGVHPVLDDCHSIAMASFKIFTRRFLPEKTLGKKFKCKFLKKIKI